MQREQSMDDVNAWKRVYGAYRVIPAAARAQGALSFAVLATALALWPALKPTAEAVNALPWIVCSTSSAESARPRTVVRTLRSEPLLAAPGKMVTTQLVHLPPLASSPPHVHGGDVTAYVIRGAVRSAHAGLAVADFRAGEMFYEPYGTTHAFFENPSATESADVLAVTIHEPGAALTTFLD
jgi:quercetin dioxygenase-like cupin family protein